MDNGDSTVGSVRMIGSAASEITSVESWRPHAAPRGGDRHWVDGRSVKELAKAWCANARVEPLADFIRLLVSTAAIRWRLCSFDLGAQPA